jgi:hypothetical protein
MPLDRTSSPRVQRAGNGAGRRGFDARPWL